MSRFFADLKTTRRTISTGPCDLPLVYRDASQFGVFFRLDISRAAALLHDTSLEPWPVLGGALGAIYAWEYRHSTLGPYNEVGVGIQARRRGSRPSLLRLGLDMAEQDDQGIWVVSLAVTSRAALVAGAEIWGYPKYLAAIETRFARNHAKVSIAGELDLSIGRVLGLPKALSVTTYTALHGRLIRGCIHTEHPVRFGAAFGARLSLTGDGATARAIRQLGIDKAKPIAGFRTDRWHGFLDEGVDLGSIDRVRG